MCVKGLLIYLKQYRKECVLGPLFKLLEALFELFVPLVMTSIIDVGIATGSRRYILERCGLLVLLAVVGLVCSITAQYFAARAATGFSARLRSALFAHLQGLSYREIDTLGSATMITRMTSDVNQLQNGVNLACACCFGPPLWCLAPWLWPLPLTSLGQRCLSWRFRYCWRWFLPSFW